MRWEGVFRAYPPQASILTCHLTMGVRPTKHTKSLPPAIVRAAWEDLPAVEAGAGTS